MSDLKQFEIEDREIRRAASYARDDHYNWLAKQGPQKLPDIAEEKSTEVDLTKIIESAILPAPESQS